MKRLNAVSLGALVAAVAMLGLVGNARAQKTFDDAARGAEWVPSRKALAPLFWAFATNCNKRKNDLARRQCKLISSARKRTITRKRFLVEADPTAFQADPYDPKKKSIAIGVRPCLACIKPLRIAGADIYVMGDKARTRTKNGGLKVATIYTSTRSFRSKKHADRWRKHVLPRLRTQFLVEIPNKPTTWRSAGMRGLKVNIIGFRVYDPCDGRIVCASPKASRERPNRRACAGKALVEDTRSATGSKVHVKKLPYRLSTRQIVRALRPAIREARKCKDTYGMTGTASFRITISSAGRIIGLKESGDFVDTPTGDCVARAVKKVRFPKSKKARTTITYPVILQ